MARAQERANLRLDERVREAVDGEEHGRVVHDQLLGLLTQPDRMRVALWLFTEPTERIASALLATRRVA